MDLHKFFVLSMSIVFLMGCSTVSGKQKDVYQQGYRQGVQEQIQQVASQFQGGNFPYYHWVAPIVQEVRIPAHLANGVMIPEHNELVIIKPGQWSVSPAYPIQTQERNNYDNQISGHNMDVSNITALPKSVGNADERERKNKDNPTGMAEQSEK